MHTSMCPTAAPSPPTSTPSPTLQEAIAAAVPDRECIVWRDRRAHLGRASPTAPGAWPTACWPRASAAPSTTSADAPGWASPHDHVALYLTNGNEYLEAMLGAWKAGAAADQRQLPLHRRRAGLRARRRRHGWRSSTTPASRRCWPRRCPTCPPSAASSWSTTARAPSRCPARSRYEDLLAGATRRPTRRHLVARRPLRRLHRRHHRHPQGRALAPGRLPRTPRSGSGAPRTELVERARRPGRPRALPAPPFMHGAAHWNALSCLLAGGTVVIQDDTEHLDPADVLDTCEREQVGSLLIVGDAFARPLLDELRRTPAGPVGAAGPHDRRRRPLPGHQGPAGRRAARTCASSTSSAPPRPAATGWPPPPPTPTPSRASSHRRTPPSSSTRTAPASSTPGDPDQRLAGPAGAGPPRLPRRRGQDRRPRSPASTASVHAVAGDRARLRSDGHIELLGRDSVTINTGGEKVHAEEVEQALKAHPGVYDALVVGRPSERWGTEIVAVVAPDPGRARRSTPTRSGPPPASTSPATSCRRPSCVVDRVQRSASGKPDYAWARRVAAGEA